MYVTGPRLLVRVRYSLGTSSVPPALVGQSGKRLYLSAMASLGSGPYRSSEVAAVMGRTTTQVGPLRDILTKRGLCYSPRRGVISFTVPMFDQFVRRSSL